MMEFWQNIVGTDIFKYSAAALMALIPVFVWIYVWFKKNQQESKHIFFVFFLGTLTVLPILGLQLLWMYHPELDVYGYINASVTNPLIWFTVTYMLAGVLEELAKGSIIYWLDFSSIQIKTINNCIKYNLLVGLGFAFSENILYFYSGIRGGDFLNLFGVFMFRGMFTVCAHMIFSSIVGYFYGLAKFSDPIVKQEKWQGREHKLVRWYAHLKGTDPRRLLPKIKWWTGVLIAMIMHGAYNLSLISGYIWLAALIVIGGFFYVRYLSTRRAGNLVLAMTGAARPSLMAPRDEEVVLELLGMWMNEGRFDEVSGICTRLLERDPDNRVVKLFQAKAEDRKVTKNTFSKFKKRF
ncbi:PrsW family intramembrane metalloprotease [Candidatus Peregrinibacteria bacterium]|nr:PrsW family intramembrane metalloprotease [Candidatus Peregrinibacteria bacterium]